MKDMSIVKQILGLRIERAMVVSTLKFSQASYIKKVMDRFNTSDAKFVKTPLASHFKLLHEQSSKNYDELERMSKIPYALAVGILIYVMVCTRPNIALAVGAMSRYMANLDEQYWEDIK